jgi:hypothetical protein
MARRALLVAIVVAVFAALELYGRPATGRPAAPPRGTTADVVSYVNARYRTPLGLPALVVNDLVASTL